MCVSYMYVCVWNIFLLNLAESAMIGYEVKERLADIM